MTKHKHNDQRGIVSIMTVLFLTILLSILTVSFLRIMNDEQQQSIDDDLSKGAYASALAGVEDAKRALAHCNSLTGTHRANCMSDLTATACPGILTASGNSLVSDGVINPSGQIGGDPALNQRYTCAFLNMATDDYIGQASPQDPVMLELVSDTNSFRQIVVRWHRIGDGADRDGPAYFAPLSVTANNPRVGEWVDGASRPAVAMLRVQLMAFESSSVGSSISLSDIDRKTAASYLVPRTTGSNTMNASVARGGTAEWSMPTRQTIRCSSSESVYQGYGCEAVINLSRTLSTSKTPGANSDRYFLMVSSQYSSPHFQISLRNNAGGEVPLYGVQPEVDSTGAAGDVYRRVLARIEFDDGYTPKDAIQSAVSLCKAFYARSGSIWQPGDSDRPAAGATACSGLMLGPNNRYPVD